MGAGKFWFILLVLPVQVYSMQIGLFSVDLGNLSERLCNETMCFRRCCTRNQVFLDSACTAQNYGFDDEDFFQTITSFFGLRQSFVIVNSNKVFCRNGLAAVVNDLKGCSLQENRLHCSEVDKPDEYQDYINYCLEYLVAGSDATLMALSCYGNEMEKAFTINGIGMIISMPFLLITFLVYALLPDRNLHQRALMFYVLSLLIAYILLVTINLAPNIPTWFWCKFLGYSTLFFFMVSFFWMNVICFDIWYTFSGGRGFMGSKRTSERRRLIFYSLYANGVPLLIVAWTYGMQISLPNECEHNPGIGVAKCFLATGWASLWYFYLEAGIVVIANITFFILTALRIRKVKQETSMLKHNDSKRHTYEKDKQKFNLYVKLLFAMGVNWSMEVISWLVNWNTKSEYQYIWYATDFFNAVYGVFIFFIFVFKKKIWTLLQRRYYNFIGRPHLAHTVTSSNTRSSHYSSTNYSTADTGLSERATAVNGRQPAEEMALRRVT
ncbi:G-protein coupled receptor Mth2 isoform X8 [Dendroctonus ponderosae]|uniref:G-protein coupled receptors family 2 profile 2 domain-containing protein n=1 Tax=Dendroctonus ponderosae TaxID=77166 RepID=A0AAR5PP39_DENPD|nr:G-protein coupled receptor Mth2 isoform X8 [Dendroctonus ponderosae]